MPIRLRMQHNETKYVGYHIHGFFSALFADNLSFKADSVESSQAKGKERTIW